MLETPELKRVILLHNHDNTWTPEDLIEVAEDNRLVMEALRQHGYEVTDVKVYNSVAKAMQAAGHDPREWLIFNWCEGYADRPWDYGGVTDELEQLKFTYTGCGPWTLRISQDKQRVRKVLAEYGVPLPLGLVAHKGSGLRWENYPAIVKPLNQHGSYGIDRAAVVFDEAELRQRVEYVLDTFHSPALIEEFIEGRELHITVWGNGLATALPATELVFKTSDDPRDQIFTYDLKFDMDALVRAELRFVCPAMLTVTARQRLKLACLQAYRALRCRDYARLDVRLRGDQPYIVDVNPNPDINSESMTTMAAEAAGMKYDDMVAQIVGFAAERKRRAGPPILLTDRAHAALGRASHLKIPLRH